MFSSATLATQNYQSICDSNSNGALNIRNICLIDEKGTTMDLLWDYLSQYVIVDGCGSAKYTDRIFDDRLQSQQKNKNSNMLSLLYTNRSESSGDIDKSRQIIKKQNKGQNEQIGQQRCQLNNKYVINIFRRKFLSILDQYFCQNIRLCDDINHRIWLQNILTILIKHHTIPIILINLSLASYKDQTLSKNIHQAIIDLIEIIQEGFEWNNFRKLDIKIQDIIVASVQNGWGFSIRQVMQVIQWYYQTMSAVISNNGQQFYQIIFVIGNRLYEKNTKKWTIISQNLDIGQNSTGKNKNKSILVPIIEFLSQFLDILFGNSSNQSKLNQFYQIVHKKLNENNIKNEKFCNNINNAFFPDLFKLNSSILRQVINSVPAPNINQQKKLRSFYFGNENDQIGKSIKMCDPKGPLLIYFSKIQIYYQYPKYHPFLCGRVLSGTWEYGQKVKIITENKLYKSNQIITSQSFLALFGRKFTSLVRLTSGNCIFFRNFQKITKRFCLAASLQSDVSSQNFNFSQNRQQNIVKMPITPRNASQLQKFHEKVKNKISYLYPNIQLQIQQTGQCVIKSCFPDILQKYSEDLSKQIKLTKENIIKIYKETITKQSSSIGMVKSPNKHNRIYGVSSPISEPLVNKLKFINNQEINNEQQKIQIFKSQAKWDIIKSGQIWSFGHEDQHYNILTNSLGPEAKFMNQIRQSVQSAFSWSMKLGALCDQSISGVSYSILDCQLISDAIHRGGGQIIPTARRLFHGLQLLSAPTLLQPFHRCTVLIKKKKKQDFEQYCSQNNIKMMEKKFRNINSNSNQSLQQEESQQLSTKYQQEGYICKIQSSYTYSYIIEVPVLKWSSILYTFCYQLKDIQTLWKRTSGLAQIGTETSQLVAQIRQRKGFNINLPDIKNYIDKY